MQTKIRFISIENYVKETCCLVVNLFLLRFDKNDKNSW